MNYVITQNFPNIPNSYVKQLDVDGNEDFHTTNYFYSVAPFLSILFAHNAIPYSQQVHRKS